MESLTCAQGHQYTREEEVICLIKPELKDKVDAFESIFAESRKADRFYQPAVEHYSELPFGPEGKAHKVWKSRRQDLEILVQAVRERTGLKVLEIGPWMGWLSNHLAKEGQEVTVVDYFLNDREGLKARKHFSNPNWTSIQMDLRDLSVLDEKFDLIIFNHCLHFMPEPHEMLASARKMLLPGGKVVILGMSIYSHPKEKAADFAREQEAFKEKYGQDLLLFPAKGYFETRDHTRFTMVGVKIMAYPGSFLSYLRAFFKPRLPWVSWGLWDESHPKMKP